MDCVKAGTKTFTANEKWDTQSERNKKPWK